MPGNPSVTDLLGYTFQNTDLLQTALTHTSAVERGRDGTDSYERLEFLGDRVIGLLIADMIYATHSDAVAGEMNRRLSAMVRRDALAEIAVDLGLDSHIILSQGEEDAGGRTKPAILADVMEAVLGAMYMDGGLEAVRPLVQKVWQPRIREDTTALRDPKSALQEWSQANAMGLPVYKLLDRSGADHAPVFTVSCTIKGQTTKASGSNKRNAERDAAATWLATYGPGSPSTYAPSDVENEL